MMAQVPSLWALAAYASMLWITCVCSCRLLLHPLSRYPGPLLARITGAYAGFYSASMNLHIKTRQDHIKYGPVVRHGPNKLLFSSPRALQDIYMNNKVVKSYTYQYTSATPGVYSVFNETDQSAHRIKRRLVGKALSDRSMKIFEPIMREQIDILLRGLLSSSERSMPVNMTESVKRFAFDVIALLACGWPLRSQTDQKYRSLIKAQTAGTYQKNILMQFPFLQKTRIFTLFGFFMSDQILAYFDAIEAMTAARLAQDNLAHHDLYACIIDRLKPSRGSLKDSELWAEIAFLFTAGADTVSTLLCGIFFYLSRTPRSYARLAEEIRSTFSTGADIINGPKLSGCEYLRATIEETLRISPPVPGTLWRQFGSTTHPEHFTVDGHVIPPGVEVGVNIYSLQHNEEYFPDSFTFSPERWLQTETGSTAAQMKLMSEAFYPFSMGTRGCPGKAMAYMETSLVLAKVMWYFDFEVAPGSLGMVGGGSPSLGEGRQRENEFQLYDVASATHDGPNLCFRPRGEYIREII
ncbi:cytochrome P450 [Whalleya microplaca]|nr:cytochrome P450 [Whalleya microplaca]